MRDKHIHLYSTYVVTFIYLLHLWQNNLKRDNRFINKSLIIFEYELGRVDQFCIGGHFFIT